MSLDRNSRERERTAVELFAGVGGFRLALERSGWRTVWANQWEPSTKAQNAFDCYVQHFLPDGVFDPVLKEVRSPTGGVAVNEDIELALDQVDTGTRQPIPDHDLLVGGFPCQDYSVAKTLNQAHGIEGKKGVLWWQILRILDEKRPANVFLENVDRLLKSPAHQRGRDFAIILTSLADLGYLVEWRVVNAADYGFPQRRRRVFILGHHIGDDDPRWAGPLSWLHGDGPLARALPVVPGEGDVLPLDGIDTFELGGELGEISDRFGRGLAVTPFASGGVMWERQVWTRRLVPDHSGPRACLGDVIQPVAEVPPEYFILEHQLQTWRYLKGAKREERSSATGHPYFYTEGAIAFPDPLDHPSRTILTGEGGSTPSRFKHVIQAENGRLRRLTPIELERLNGFPDDWTNTGMTDGRRAFMMGNALVTGLVRRVAEALKETSVAGGPPQLEAAASR